jgi:hypothetical protein
MSIKANAQARTTGKKQTAIRKANAQPITLPKPSNGARPKTK